MTRAIRERDGNRKKKSIGGQVSENEGERKRAKVMIRNTLLPLTSPSSLFAPLFRSLPPLEFIVPQAPIKDDSQFCPKIIQSRLIGRIYSYLRIVPRPICHNVYFARRENANTALIPLPQANGWSLINTRKPTSVSTRIYPSSSPPLDHSPEE